MSQPAHHHTPPPEHRTLNSYIIGYILSLIFTIIPYYMVQHHVVWGNALLLSIMGIAVFQMLVQIFFFLHLGRGPKPFYNVVFFIGTVTTILVVAGGSMVIINNLHRNKAPVDQTKILIESEGISQINGEKTGACEGQYQNHLVTIKNGIVSPQLTTAQKCDTLTFSNQDIKTRDITFGVPPSHTTYVGESDYSLRSGSNKTITLSQTGTYQFYDHTQPGITGYFTVK